MNRDARINRKNKISTIIQEDIGPNNEFTVYTIYGLWAKRYSRQPSIKELSKVLPTNPALHRSRDNLQEAIKYTWDGESDLFCYTLDSEEKRKKFKELKKLEENRQYF